jgi:uncharacterized protein (DUF58 family)
MAEPTTIRFPARPSIIARLHHLATYDAFPHFSVHVRRALYHPLSVLLFAATAAFLCGLFLHPHGFVLCGGIAVVVLLGVAWPWLTLRGIGGTLTFDRARCVEGDAVEICLTLKNRLWWPGLGLLVRRGFAQPAAEDALAPVASVAAAPRRRTAQCRWRFLPPCRGLYPVLGPRLATGFPFGLWESSRALVVQSPLIVWPRTFPVGPVPLTGGDEPAHGNVSRNNIGTNGDVVGVRPYRRGDSPRRIHWSQSARHDRLIVCELQATVRPVIHLVLDADPRNHAGAGGESAREWAIRIAASLAKGWLQAGARVGAAWHGEVFAPDAGERHLRRLLDSLAKLPQAQGPSLADVLEAPACRSVSAGLQVIITTDAALSAVPRTRCDGERRRWVVLRSAAFGAEAPAPADLPVRPWLLIDAVERIPALLRGGWKEAQHGT